MDVISAERTTTTQAHSDNGGDMVISFWLHEKTYALPLTSVVQVVPMVQITPLPYLSSHRGHVHQAVAGIINYRGAAVPIVNMRRYLDLPEQAPGLHTPILLITLEEEARIIGLIVDEVIDVMHFASGDIVQLSDIMPEGLGEASILRGLAHTETGTMLMLDADQLFSTDHDGNGLGAALEEMEAAAVAPEPESAAEPEPEREEVTV